MKIDTDKLKEFGAKVLKSAKDNGAEFLDTMKEGCIGIAQVTSSIAKNSVVEGKKVAEVATKETKKAVSAVKVGVAAATARLNEKE